GLLFYEDKSGLPRKAAMNQIIVQNLARECSNFIVIATVLLVAIRLKNVQTLACYRRLIA
ncbi:hypothetical protein AB6D74_22270, partial [Vibrio cyclitrophicus]